MQHNQSLGITGAFGIAGVCSGAFTFVLGLVAILIVQTLFRVDDLTQLACGFGSDGACQAIRINTLGTLTGTGLLFLGAILGVLGLALYLIHRAP